VASLPERSKGLDLRSSGPRPREFKSHSLQNPFNFSDLHIPKKKMEASNLNDEVVNTNINNAQGAQEGQQQRKNADLDTSNIMNRTTFRSNNVLKAATLNILGCKVEQLKLDLDRDNISADDVKKVLGKVVEAYNGLVGSFDTLINQMSKWASQTNDDIAGLQNASSTQVDRIEIVMRRVDEAVMRFGRDLEVVGAAISRTNLAPGFQQQQHGHYVSAFNDINLNNSFGSFNDNNNNFIGGNNVPNNVNNNINVNSLNNNNGNVLGVNPNLVNNNNLINNFSNQNNVMNNQNVGVNLNCNQNMGVNPNYNQNVGVNSNYNPNLGYNASLQNNRGNQAMQANLFAPDQNAAVKLFLEESAVLENENVMGNYEVQQSNGAFAIYALQTRQNRLEFRRTQREATMADIGEHRCLFRKVLAQNGDVAYEVCYKADNFDMERFVRGKISNVKEKFNPRKAGDGREKDYYYTFKYNGHQLQFVRRINKGNERFGCRNFFTQNEDNKFAIFVNGKDGSKDKKSKGKADYSSPYSSPKSKKIITKYVTVPVPTEKFYAQKKFVQFKPNYAYETWGPSVRGGPRGGFNGNKGGGYSSGKPKYVNGGRFVDTTSNFQPRRGFGGNYRGSGQRRYGLPGGFQPYMRNDGYGNVYDGYGPGSWGNRNFMTSSRY
jgi:hypothetical protein